VSLNYNNSITVEQYNSIAHRKKKDYFVSLLGTIITQWLPRAVNFSSSSAEPLSRAEVCIQLYLHFSNVFKALLN
jgi:hypothetical protein